MKTVLKRGIRAYQHLISRHTPSSCRFSPTCSNYGLTALERFGAARGTWLTVKRVARCGPWSAPGHDPVPLALGRSCGRTCELARYGKAAWCLRRHARVNYGKMR